MATNSVKLKQFPKKKQTAKLKNILAQPYPRYWPEINLEEIVELQSILRKVKSICNDETALKKSFKLGIKSCFRALSRKDISFLLLSSDIKPHFIVSQILNYAHNNKNTTPILCVPNLSQLTGEIFGVNSLTLAHRQNMDSAVSEWVISKFCKYKRPEIKIGNDITNKRKVKAAKSKTKPAKIDSIDTSSLYLKKTGSERAFIPKGARRINMLEDKHEGWGDYISLSKPKNQTLNIIPTNEEEDSDHEKTNLLNAIKQRIAKSETKGLESDVEMANAAKKKTPVVEKSLGSSQKYISMSVHKIQPQVNKKQKRKKSQKKNKTG